MEKIKNTYKIMDKAHNLKLSYEFMKHIDDNSIESLNIFFELIERTCENSIDLSVRLLPIKFKKIVDFKEQLNLGMDFVKSIHDFSNEIMNVEDEEYIEKLMNLFEKNKE
jgi:3-dehydroquinate dehydratase